MEMKNTDLVYAIETAIGSGFKIDKQTSLGGGSINSALRIEGGGCAYFVKTNRADRLSMFEAEAEGLREIAGTTTVRVPDVIACGAQVDSAFLVLELLRLSSLTPQSERLFGEKLAAMHRKTQSYFGWARDNTIGSTPQSNQQCDSWIEFWRDHRLAFQLNLARENGCDSALFDRGALLCEKFHAFFDSYSPVPSLLHGDLWAGNAAADESGRPVIFDPACYYGDRECDLAMTELFGGFGREFYRAYEEAWAIDVGYRIRKKLYNLYHVLNHFNLFGGGYQRQAESMVQALIAEIG